MADCSLVLRSQHRVMTLYFLFLCCVGFGCYMFYWSFVRDILWYPEFRTLSHYQLQWNYQPKMLTLFLLILYFLTCSLVCSMYVIAKVSLLWSSNPHGFIIHTPASLTINTSPPHQPYSSHTQPIHISLSYQPHSSLTNQKHFIT